MRRFTPPVRARADAGHRADYTWYLLIQSQTYTPTPTPTASGSTLPTWRRGDSKIDWSAEYATIHRPVVVEEDDGEEGVDDEGVTMREEREEKWREENEGVTAGMDKVEARKFYKVSTGVTRQMVAISNPYPIAVSRQFESQGQKLERSTTDVDGCSELRRGDLRKTSVRLPATRRC